MSLVGRHVLPSSPAPLGQAGRRGAQQRPQRRREAEPPAIPEFLSRGEIFIINRAQSPKLGNDWVFGQLIFGPCWPMNQLNKNPNIAKLRNFYRLSFLD